MSPKSRSIAATHYLTSWANKRHFPGTQRRSRNWLSGMQFIEQDLDLFQIVCIEALDEPAVDRSEKLAGLLLLALSSLGTTSPVSESTFCCFNRWPVFRLSRLKLTFSLSVRPESS